MRMRFQRCVALIGLFLLLVLGTCFAEETASPLYPIRQNGLWGYMNREGETVIVPQWAMAFPFSGKTALVWTQPHIIGYEWYGDAVIDCQGNYVVEPEIGRTVEEYPSAYRIHENKGEGFCDKASGFCQMFGSRYRQIDLWGEDGTGPIGVVDDDGRLGYVDRQTGDLIIPFQYDSEFDDDCFRNGYALCTNEYPVYDESGEEVDVHYAYHLIDQAGNETLFPDGIHAVSGVSRDCVIISREEESTDESSNRKNIAWKKGIAKTDGTIIVEPKYDWLMEPDTDGMICILEWTEDGILCGHMDLDGNVIVKPLYRIESGDALPEYTFQNGFAILEVYEKEEGHTVNERYVILRKDGLEVFSHPHKRDDGRYFGFPNDSCVLPNGLLWYKTWSVDEKAYGQRNVKYGLLLVEEDGVRFLTEDIFDACVCDLEERMEWPEEEAFGEGMHPAQLGNKWGYINEQAELVFEPVWEQACGFHDGLALVQQGGKLAYIDPEGQIVWKEE